MYISVTSAEPWRYNHHTLYEGNVTNRNYVRFVPKSESKLDCWESQTTEAVQWTVNTLIGEFSGSHGGQTTRLNIPEDIQPTLINTQNGDHTYSDFIKFC
jgi:hypothetical protein